MSNIFYPNHIVEINVKSDGINLGIPSLLYHIINICMDRYLFLLEAFLLHLE